MTKHDKSKSRAIFIVEKALDIAFKDAVMRFPLEGESHEIIDWFEELRLIIIETVKRQTICYEQKHRDLSVEEKAKKILELAYAAVERIRKVEKRRAGADYNLTLELPPGPQLSEEPDEKAAPPEKMLRPE